MRLLCWRAAITIVRAAVVLGYFWDSGRSGYTVQIDYSWMRESLEGAEVIIDGEVAGTLRRPWSATGSSNRPGRNARLSSERSQRPEAREALRPNGSP